MEHIIIAFANEELSHKCRAALVSSGIRVYSICTSVSEVLRNISGTGGGIIISGYKFPDGTANDIVKNMPWGFSLLLVSHSPSFKQGNPSVFFLPQPVSSQAIVASVRMIQQFKSIQPPRHKNEEEINYIKTAKEKLMREYNITEEKAHKLIQGTSMKMRVKTGETAKAFLQGEITYEQLKE